MVILEKKKLLLHKDILLYKRVGQKRLLSIYKKFPA